MDTTLGSISLTKRCSGMEEKDPKGLMEGKDVYKFGWICNKKTVCFVFYTHTSTQTGQNPLDFQDKLEIRRERISVAVS